MHRPLQYNKAINHKNQRPPQQQLFYLFIFSVDVSALWAEGSAGAFAVQSLCVGRVPTLPLLNSRVHTQHLPIPQRECVPNSISTSTIREMIEINLCAGVNIWTHLLPALVVAWSVAVRLPLLAHNTSGILTRLTRHERGIE